MYQAEECASRYRRLMRRMEEDHEAIAQGLKGELLEAYREVLVREKEVLTDALKDIQNR